MWEHCRHRSVRIDMLKRVCGLSFKFSHLLPLASDLSPANAATNGPELRCSSTARTAVCARLRCSATTRSVR
jgi:hypothetical protein